MQCFLDHPPGLCYPVGSVLTVLLPFDRSARGTLWPSWILSKAQQAFVHLRRVLDKVHNRCVSTQ